VSNCAFLLMFALISYTPFCISSLPLSHCEDLPAHLLWSINLIKLFTLTYTHLYETLSCLLIYYSQFSMPPQQPQLRSDYDTNYSILFPSVSVWRLY
jgi:hypothetical protein